VARLALLDAAGGDVGAAMERVRDIEGPVGGVVRHALIEQALTALAADAPAAEVIALLHDADVAPATLAVSEQVRIARSYRQLGLNDEAWGVAEHARAAAGAAVPAELWEEAALIAEARQGWRGLQALTDAWLAAAADPGRAHAVRARALAEAGRPRAALDELVRAVATLDAVAVRDLRIAVGVALRPHDGRIAQQLLEQAATATDLPGLPAARSAELLWALGDVAARNGDVTAARAAFGALAERHRGEPAAALAAYRHARLTTAGERPQRPGAAFDGAVASGDGLERRAAEAARQYETIMTALDRMEAP
jgi:hypothetical protein